MMDVMDQGTPQEKLVAVLVDASTVVEHAERLLASAEDNTSAFPAHFVHDLGVLVEELRDLRDDLHNASRPDESPNPTS
jgi:hypothetical protein